MTFAVVGDVITTFDTDAEAPFAKGELACESITEAKRAPFCKSAILDFGGVDPEKKVIQFFLMALVVLVVLTTDPAL